jgi:general secretion pathway protein F
MTEAGTAARLFRYTAREAGTGRRRTGEQLGADAYAVRATLRRAGLTVEQVHEIATGPAATAVPSICRQAWWARQRRRRRSQRADLADAIATMLGAGLPLDAALTTLIASPVRPTAERHMLIALREGLRAGSPFSEAAAAHPGWFDALDLAMLRAGQQAGDLIPVLRSLAEHHQRIGELGHQLLAALAYPALLLTLAIGVTVFLSQTTLPKLATLILDAGGQVPALTSAVISIGAFLVGEWPLVVAGLLGGGWLLSRLPQWLPAGSSLRRWCGTTLIARTRRRSRIANLASTLARLLRSGLPLVEGLQAVAATGDSRALSTAMLAAAERIRGGGTLSDAIAQADLFDPEFAQLLRLGEDSGELPQMLDRIADRYRRVAQRSLERLTALLEPGAILALAILIGLIAFAAVLPLLAISRNL